MAIPSSGPVSFSDIQTEFGGSNPISMNEYYAGGANVPAGTTGTNGAVPSSGQISVNQFYGTSDVVIGSQSYTTPGTYSWVAPAGVTSVSIVAVGGGGAGSPAKCCGFMLGGAGGGGGGLGYKNNYSVTPGNSYTVVVGYGGRNTGSGCASSGSNSYFVCTATVRGGFGQGLSSYVNSVTSAGGTYTGNGGGNGGTGGFGSYCYNGNPGGGGGAGGYAGAGGDGKNASGSGGTDGAGGGGGGGGQGLAATGRTGGGGGGVGVLGQGASGAAGGSYRGGGGGSGGCKGGGCGEINSNGRPGGAYGGGGSGPLNTSSTRGVGAGGAVRIVWPGNTRTFPSTCVGSP